MKVAEYHQAYFDGMREERNRIIALLDGHVCWECAQTRPVYAHQTCSSFDDAVAIVRGTAEKE